MKQYWYQIRGILLLLAIILVILAVDITAVVICSRHVDNFLASQPENIHADAGVLFFGDYKKDEKIYLGADTKKRAQVALDLFRSGKIRHIICVGGYEQSFWKGKPHLLRNYLVNNEIPSNVIVHDSVSFNTITNWQEAEKIIDRQGYDTVILISAPFHLFRISHMIDREHVFFAGYRQDIKTFREYWTYYRHIHHEFISQFLNFALNEKLRNKLVFFYRLIANQIKSIF
jgi:uncharacterized SAM-binding protein YcdF (DUF218 family)